MIKPANMKKFKYLSLFSGIGGFELGIGNKGECIGYAEKDKYANEIYRKWFPKHRPFGDVTKINPQNLPSFDLLVGGFPCQAFSIAGKRRGFKDTRGTLFFEIARIVRGKRPRLLLLENVKGLLSHKAGETFFIILSTLDELGYDCQWQVLNSKDFGVPQSRERVFIIGHLRGTRRPEVFPLTEDDCGDPSKGKREEPISLCIQTRGGQRYDPTSETYIANSITTKHNAPGKTQARRTENLIAGTLSGGGHSGGLHSDMDLILNQISVRRLTPKECERLQGFPDGWTDGISNTQKYKCLGNAVTVNKIKAVINKLYKEYLQSLNKPHAIKENGDN